MPDPTPDAATTARLWADQLDRDLADPGIKSGTMVWMPWQAIRDVADALRELADSHARVTAERDAAYQHERERWESARRAFGPGVGDRGTETPPPRQSLFRNGRGESAEPPRARKD